MLQNTQEKSKSMDETYLLEEILLTLKDEFNCLIVQSGSRAMLHFEDEVFCLTLQKLPKTGKT